LKKKGKENGIRNKNGVTVSVAVWKTFIAGVWKPLKPFREL
jgi:hypothetical protein